MTVGINASSACWLVPQDIGASDIAQRVDTIFRPAVSLDQRQRMVLHDTFAWQLWFADLLLCKLDSTCMLCHVQRPSVDEAIAVCNNLEEVPRFCWDWPEGTVRDKLSEIIDLRALSPVVELEVVTQRIDLRNEDDKTVVRIIFQQYVRPSGDAQQVLGTCRVAPIRGYIREQEAVQGSLQAWGLPRCETSPVKLIMEQSGRRPQRWSSKPGCLISPTMAVRETTRRLAAASLDICRRCESGIIDDVDTEFLHDYRVGLRRVRSLLKLVKDTYPADITRQVLTQLGLAARRTNRLRDLDVYLLKRDEYLSHAPPDLTGALAAMFDELQAERMTHQQAVAEHLGSNTYRTMMEQVADVFEETKWWPVTLNSHVTVQSLAGRVIQKRYKKICRMIDCITPESPDVQVHDVRLNAKKLRYLLEFFGDIFPRDALRLLTRRLKKLQGVLGTFNDLAVQQQSLREYVRRKNGEQIPSEELVLGVGSLLGTLHRQQVEVRRDLNHRLRSFADEETRNLVQELRNQRSQAA